MQILQFGFLDKPYVTGQSATRRTAVITVSALRNIKSVPSHATAYLGYHFQNSLSTTFLIYFSIISLIFKSSSFLPIKNVPPPRLLSSSVPLLFSLLFLSDECYLITAVFNCQCFLYISCNSEYSENQHLRFQTLAGVASLLAVSWQGWETQGECP